MLGHSVHWGEIYGLGSLSVIQNFPGGSPVCASGLVYCPAPAELEQLLLEAQRGPKYIVFSGVMKTKHPPWGLIWGQTWNSDLFNHGDWLHMVIT